MAYDLEERTIRFSNEVIKFCKELSKADIYKSMANQLVRSGTSVGANYCEANGASIKKDFRNKIHICKKEAQETRYWLKILSNEPTQPKITIDMLLDGIEQLIRIFASIAEKSK